MTAATVHGEKTRESLRILAAGIHQAAELTLRSAIEATVESAKGTTLFKDRSERTRKSIRGQRAGLTGFVEARGAARFLEEGTVPHIIASHGKVLRFTVGGRVLFRHWVHHPGTAERPFMREARERGIIAAEWGAEFFVGEAIRRAH